MRQSPQLAPHSVRARFQPGFGVDRVKAKHDGTSQSNTTVDNLQNDRMRALFDIAQLY